MLTPGFPMGATSTTVLEHRWELNYFPFTKASAPKSLHPSRMF